MIPTRILVPVDKSACAAAAVARAAAFAKAFGADLTLVHVWDPLNELGVLMDGATVRTSAGSVPLLQHLADIAKDTLREHERALVGNSFTITTKLLEGPIKRAIADLMKSGDYDMVVMGTHGRSGVERLLMGSVAEWVVRHANVPVMTVQAQAEAA